MLIGELLIGVTFLEEVYEKLEGPKDLAFLGLIYEKLDRKVEVKLGKVDVQREVNVVQKDVLMQEKEAELEGRHDQSGGQNVEKDVKDAVQVLVVV